MLLAFWKSTPQLFCRLSLTFGLSHVSLSLDADYSLLAGIPQKLCWVLPSALYRRDMLLLHPIPNNVNFECLSKVISASFLYCNNVLQLKKVLVGISITL